MPDRSRRENTALFIDDTGGPVLTSHFQRIVINAVRQYMAKVNGRPVSFEEARKARRGTSWSNYASASTGSQRGGRRPGRPRCHPICRQFNQTHQLVDLYGGAERYIQSGGLRNDHSGVG